MCATGRLRQWFRTGSAARDVHQGTGALHRKPSGASTPWCSAFRHVDGWALAGDAVMAGSEATERRSRGSAWHRRLSGIKLPSMRWRRPSFTTRRIGSSGRFVAVAGCGIGEVGGHHVEVGGKPSWITRTTPCTTRLWCPRAWTANPGGDCHVFVSVDDYSSAP